MFLTAAATLPPDTVYVLARNTAQVTHNEWALGALAGIALSLAGWALTRSVSHGEAIQELRTFTGADGKNGLAGKVDAVDEKVGRVEDKIDAIVASVGIVATSVARLQGHT